MENCFTFYLRPPSQCIRIIHWNNKLDLESEEVHFFAREKANQLLCIENFIRENYQTAKILSEG